MAVAYQKRRSGPILVALRRFPLALMDAHCYIFELSGTPAGAVPGLNTDMGMNMQQERWLSVDEIAAHMGVNPDTVYKWIKLRKLPPKVTADRAYQNAAG